jgi:hypothetical protein
MSSILKALVGPVVIAWLVTPDAANEDIKGSIWSFCFNNAVEDGRFSIALNAETLVLDNWFCAGVLTLVSCPFSICLRSGSEPLPPSKAASRAPLLAAVLVSSSEGSFFACPLIWI